MKAFDQTYADPEFQRQILAAREGWMAQVPPPRQPDLEVPGLTGSFFARILSAMAGRRR
jgi:hypothetical protein